MVRGEGTAKKTELHNAWVVCFTGDFTLAEAC